MKNSTFWYMKLEEVLKKLEQVGEVEGFTRIPREDIPYGVYTGKAFLKLTDQQKEEVRQVIRPKLTELLLAVGVDFSKNLICPFHDDTTPSLTYDSDTHTLHCWACFEAGKTKDIIDVVGDLFNIKFFTQQYDKVQELIVERGSNSQLKYSSYYPFHKDSDALKALQERCISVATACKYNLQVMSYGKESKYICMPVNDSFMVRKKIKGGDKWNDNWNPKGSHVVPHPMQEIGKEYNDEPVFLVEGMWDMLAVCEAFALEERRASVISLNGVNSTRKFVEELEALAPQREEVTGGEPKKVKLIILLDNDFAGKQKAEQLRLELKRRGYPYVYKETYEVVSKNYYEKEGETFKMKSGISPNKRDELLGKNHLREYKDASEALVADMDATAANLMYILEKAEKEFNS